MDSILSTVILIIFIVSSKRRVAGFDLHFFFPAGRAFALSVILFSTLLWNRFVKYPLALMWSNGFAIAKYCASHKVKFSVPLTSADTSRPGGLLHLRRKLHVPKGTLNEKTVLQMLDGFCVLVWHYRCFPLQASELRIRFTFSFLWEWK